MKNIKKIEIPDERTELLHERKRLSVDLAAKRLIRDDIVKSTRLDNAGIDADLVRDRLCIVCDEIEALQISFMNIYHKTSHWMLSTDATATNHRVDAVHITPMPRNGDVTLKATRNILVCGVTVEAGESFITDVKTAALLLDTNKVIVNERYLAGVNLCH